jgi:hypothetical protein
MISFLRCSAAGTRAVVEYTGSGVRSCANNGVDIFGIKYDVSDV